MASPDQVNGCMGSDVGGGGKGASQLHSAVKLQMRTDRISPSRTYLRHEFRDELLLVDLLVVQKILQQVVHLV